MAEVTSRLRLEPMEPPIPKYLPLVTAVEDNRWWSGQLPRDDKQLVRSIPILWVNQAHCQDQEESLICDPKHFE